VKTFAQRDTNGRLLRTIPPLMLTYYNLCVEERLSLCLGRAAYLVNRHYNGDLRRLGLAPTYELSTKQLRRARIRALCSIKESTAQRWTDHWEANGSLKSLRYRQAEWNQIRRENRKENR
jgi:hypothetical protein